MLPAIPEISQNIIETGLTRQKGIKVSVLREDLVHPYLSGNKWRKLKYNLQEFKESGKEAILTFGGKYSNHLVACAAAGKMFKIPFIGILRGDEEVENEHIRFLRKCGMQLIPISREEYRLRNEAGFTDELFSRYQHQMPPAVQNGSDLFYIPEGGSNTAGVKGCTEIIENVPVSATHICCACGTGASLAGITLSLAEHQLAVGISVLRGENFLDAEVVKHGADPEKFELSFDYHFGGYAKAPDVLKEFCTQFTEDHHIPLEPVYTGKLFYGIFDLIKKNRFPPGSEIILIHTGGIFDFSKAF